ncbi:MAG: MgtC/SapB family protein [Lachnospiraceae bacterium]|nr:MgtC/SapB family protein [Lachnospiraceae bacterium]
MIDFLDYFRGISLLSIFVRLLLCVICGGLIGLEREFKRRPAGFRTHILVCLGAAMTTLTGEFLLLYMHYETDMGRLGAQVVAGIGFLGAGTIITRRERVRGLTTAAGLWTAAVVGLAIGAGFYEGALIATLLVEMAELIFSRVEYRMLERAPELSLYIEYRDKDALESLMRLFRSKNVKLLDLQITRQKSGSKHNACAIVSLRVNKKAKKESVLREILKTDGVMLAEEL